MEGMGDLQEGEGAEVGGTFRHAPEGRGTEQKDYLGLYIGTA